MSDADRRQVDGCARDNRRIGHMFASFLPIFVFSVCAYSVLDSFRLGYQRQRTV
jgi:hypothetical protein